MRTTKTKTASMALAILTTTAACGWGAGASPTDPPADDIGSVAAKQTAAEAAGWRSQVLYLVMTDRFRNGDASNDGAGAPDCHDPNDPHRFHGGDLEGLRENLGYVRDVGATAIWVTPLYRQIARLPNGQCGYHGYWADYADPDTAAIEPKLGTAADLHALVSDMHASSMRLVLDMVVNHSGDTASLPKTHPTWFHDPATCQALGNPTIWCPLDGHPDFAQERPEVASYLSAVAARWMSTYAIDGIRMDTARHVPSSYFQTSFFPAVRAVKPDLFAVAEIFDESSAAPLVPYVDAGFDSAFHFVLRRALVDGIAHGGSVDRVASAVADGVARLGMERALDLVLMMDNHDVPRFASEAGWGVPEDLIRRREMLALDLLFTLPGIPQLYYGDELGLYGGGDPDNRRDLPSWATSGAARSAAHPGEAVAGSNQIFDRVAKLTRTRTSTPALADGAYRELWRQNGPQNPNVLAFARGSGPDARIVVVSNGTARSGTVRIPIPAAVMADGTTLEDVLGDGGPATIAIGAGTLAIDMPGMSAAIYRRRP